MLINNVFKIYLNSPQSIDVSPVLGTIRSKVDTTVSALIFSTPLPVSPGL